MATIHAMIQTALAPLIERINGFAALEADWDSYGAARPTPEALAAATRCLQIFVGAVALEVGDDALPFWIAPLPNGGVQLEWRGPSAELEVEVGPDGALAYFLQEGHGTNTTYEEGEDASLPDVLFRVLIPAKARTSGP